MSGNLINIKVVFNVIGNLIIITGLLMATAIPFSLYYDEGDLYPLILSSLTTLFLD